MAATVLIKRLTGATPDLTNITSINTRMKRTDAHATGGSDFPVPAGGTLDVDAYLSCWVVTQLDVTVAADNDVTGLKWWGDDVALDTGLKIRGESATAYTQSPTTNLVFGQAGELKIANYATLTAPVDLWNTAATGTYVSTAKKSVAGSAGQATGPFGDRMCYQVQCASTAGAGPIAARTATWSYDET